MTHDQIVGAVRATGLEPRGAFHPEADDGVPPGGDGARAGTVVLVGNAGPGMWAAFAASPERREDIDHPLDAWSRRVVGALAADLGARALFPFGGPPWLPFARWAERADTVWPSPIGPLIHPEYGLWHAYRGALAFVDRIALPSRAPAARPCDACPDRPCLATCPVGAFGPGGFDAAACAAHIRRPAGAACLGAGCLARAACPVGREWRYSPAQAEFHMHAFLGARSPGR